VFIKKTIKKKKRVTKMKIRLTESQYKRLLNEDDKSFLDGDVDFANIDNKVTPVVAKIFIVLKNKNFEPSSDYLRMKNPIESQNFRKIAEELRTLTGYENDEVILLTHNYSTWLDDDIKNTDDWKSLVGLPLEYYGKMNHPHSVNWSGYLSGWGDGSVSAYATNYDDFQQRVEDGDVEIEYENGEIDYDDRDIQWERNYDFDYDNLSDLEIDLNNISFNG
jgi:hypothetical protein